jgi:hypothetical protein
MFGHLWDWIGLAMVVTIIYILVRPQSKAADAVEAIGNTMVSMVRRAVDLAE